MIWDYLQKRAAGCKESHEKLSVIERLFLEHKSGTKPSISTVSLEGLTPEEIAELTAPCFFDDNEQEQHTTSST